MPRPGRALVELQERQPRRGLDGHSRGHGHLWGSRIPAAAAAQCSAAQTAPKLARRLRAHGWRCLRLCLSLVGADPLAAALAVAEASRAAGAGTHQWATLVGGIGSVAGVGAVGGGGARGDGERAAVLRPNHHHAHRKRQRQPLAERYGTRIFYM